MRLSQISAERMSYLCIRRPYDPNMFSLQLVALFFVWRGRPPYASDLDGCTCAQPARSNDVRPTQLDEGERGHVPFGL